MLEINVLISVLNLFYFLFSFLLHESEATDRVWMYRRFVASEDACTYGSWHKPAAYYKVRITVGKITIPIPIKQYYIQDL